MINDSWSFPGLRLEFNVHPEWLLDAEDFALISLYTDYSRDTGAFLPFSGGVADQPACVMASLKIIAGADAIIMAERRNRG